MTANERRKRMLELLSDIRVTSREYLAEHFKVSKHTIDRDILELSCDYPIFTVQGKGGGIRVADGWYVSRRYLQPDQEDLLRSLIPGLQPEDRAKMEEILRGFARPKT